MSSSTAIEKSLTTFICGLFSLVPGLGIFPAVHAFSCWLDVRTHFGGQWNPASTYLRCGVRLALLGLLSSLLLAWSVILALLCRVFN